MSSLVEPTEETLAALRGASTATLQTQLFARGLRNTFLFGLRPLNPGAARFAAEAFTLRYIPAREDLDVLEAFRDPRHPQRHAIESVGPGQALVMDCRGDARAASAGHILTTRLLRRGAAALVTDGSVRDSPAIRRMEFPVFTSAVSATTNLVLHHAVDLQVPIGCGGVAVFPGDILVGDDAHAGRGDRRASGRAGATGALHPGAGPGRRGSAGHLCAGRRDARRVPRVP